MRRALALTLLLLLAARPRPAAADEPDRFSPSSRGPRASYATEQVQRWRDAVDPYPWHTDTALLVMSCESQGVADAVNPSSGAAGLFQIMPLLHRWRAWRLFGEWRSFLDAGVNIAVAAELYAAGGWAPWYSSARCWR